MANLNSPISGGGFTPVNRSPGIDSISSGLPAHDENKRRSDVVAAVVGYIPSKASPEPVRELVVSSSSEDAGGHHSGGVLAASGNLSQQGSATSGRWRGGGRVTSAAIPLQDGVAQSVKISVLPTVDPISVSSKPPKVPSQGDEGTKQGLSASALLDHTKKSRASNGGGSLSSAVGGTSLSGVRSATPTITQRGGGGLSSAVGSTLGGGGLTSAAGGRSGHAAREVIGTGTLVDFDASIAAALESEIMHPGPQLVSFLHDQAELHQRIKIFQEQIEFQHTEMRNAAHHALLAEQKHSALNLLLTKEREQFSSVVQKHQWSHDVVVEKLHRLESSMRQQEQEECRLANEKYAKLEAGIRQMELNADCAARLEMQSAKAAFEQESFSWIHSEQAASSLFALQSHAERESMISNLEQQAEGRHVAQMAELRYSAQLKFQEQENRAHSLEEELVRLQGELIRNSQCQAPVDGGGGSSSAVIDDAKSLGTVVALKQEVGAAQDRVRRWAGRERELHHEIVQETLTIKLDTLIMTTRI